MFLSTLMPMKQDGSIADYNLYFWEPSQWCNSILAHGLLDWRLLEVGDEVITTTEDDYQRWEVVKMDYVDYDWWMAEGWTVSMENDPNHIYLHTCATTDKVLMVRLERQEQRWK